MENVYYVVKGYAKDHFSYYVILDDSKNIETVTFQTRLTGLAGRFINVIGEQSKLLLGIKYKPPIDVRIVRLPDYIRADKLEEMNDKNILNGIGELLTEKQKAWAKAKLKLETILQLKLRLEAEN